MKRLALCLLLICFAGLTATYAKKSEAKQTTYNIIYIGNSITAGALHADAKSTAPPIPATAAVAKKIEGKGVEVAGFSNCGRSGATTVDFLPERNRDFKRVEKAIEGYKAAEKEGTKYVFSIMLGTNDSASQGPTGSPVSNEDYKKNLLTIISRLREMCPDAIFVLQRPIWYSPNTYNGARYLVAGLNRMTDYITVLVELANENGDIYLGDCDSYDLFKHEYKKLMFAEDGKAGTFYLHPTEEGAVELAKNWAKAIVAAMKAARR
ncbi:MAG: lipolytic protein G-D-S-L family [Alistipes sp.]|nr:lipolytic protein G-D-S-L family [Alistipes sp.]